MKRLFTLLIVMEYSVFCFAQTVTLKFTGRDANGQYCPLNQVTINNLSQNWQETLNWPDTTLILNNEVGVSDYGTRSGLNLSQNIPNPFTGTTEVRLDVADNEDVLVEIADLSGKMVLSKNLTRVQAGTYVLHVQLSSPQTYVLTVHQGKNIASIKMVNKGAADRYVVSLLEHVAGKHIAKSEKAVRSNVTHPWTVGDNLSIEGYATIGGTEYSQSLSMQLTNDETVTIQFQGAAPPSFVCGVSTLTDIDNNTYNTVQIGNQCWMKENLRTTRYADGTDIPAGYSYESSMSSSYFYDYLYSDMPLAERGYLYNWPAAMHGAPSSDANPSGVQGVCPTGWHLPSDAEWTQLTNHLSAHNEFVCNDTIDNIAKALASTSGWLTSTENCAVGNDQTTNNASGFDAFPAGICNMSFGGTGEYAYFWSSTQIFGSWVYFRGIGKDDASVLRDDRTMNFGFSVRCLRD